MKRTLVVLSLLVTLASAALAETPASWAPREVPSLEPDAATTREIVVGTAVPAGRSFAITLDERSIDRAYPAWARPRPGAWTTTVTKEQFRSMVRDVVNLKLAAMFPDGLAPDAASDMKIEIRINLGKPPEIGITIGC